MKGEGRMSSRRTSKCSPADLLEGLEKKNGEEKCFPVKDMARDSVSAAISGCRIVVPPGNIAQRLLLSGSIV